MVQNQDSPSDKLVTVNIYARKVAQLEKQIEESKDNGEIAELGDQLASCQVFVDSFMKTTTGSRLRQIYSHRALNKVLCDLFAFPGLRLDWNPNAADSMMKRRVLNVSARIQFLCSRLSC